MKKLIFVLVGITLSATKLFAQQDPQYTMYMWNQLSVNPAYAGSRECLSATALYRTQWVKLDGSPRTINVGIHSPLRNERVGLGFNITGDQLGISSFTNISGSYAYRFPVNQVGKLSIGLQATVTTISHKFNELTVFDAGDENFTNPVKNFTVANFGTGAYYSTAKSYIGLSIPHIVNNRLNEKTNGTVSTATSKQFRHLFLMAGRVFSLSDLVKVKPSGILKFVPNAPAEIDGNVSFILSDALWLGASYRSNFSKISINKIESIDLMAIYEINHTMRLGFAYDITLSKLKNYNNGTYELMLGYDFSQQNRKIATPRYF
jgi:type IX secretion system PorP/SprF family membrane protein